MLSSQSLLGDRKGTLNQRLGLAILEKALGPEHPNVVQGKKNYAFLLSEMGRSDARRPLWKRLVGALGRSVAAK